MAADITAKSVLDRITERHLKCHICTDHLKEPKMLECSHSFCLSCLHQLAKKEERSSHMLTCPMCRGQTLLTGKGVVDLRTDFKMTSLIEEIKQHENALERQKDKQALGIGWNVPACNKHPHKGLIMYCNKCKKLVCTTCIGKDHTKHPVIELDEALEKCKQDAKQLIAKLERNKIKLMITVQGIVMSRKMLDSMLADTKEKICKGAEKKISEVKEEQRQLIQEAEQIHEDRVKTFEAAQKTNSHEMDKADHKRDEVKQLMDQGNCFSILHSIDKLLQDLKEYTEIQPSRVPYGLSYIDFEESGSLGRLLLQDVDEPNPRPTPCAKTTHQTWTLQTETMKYLSGENEMDIKWAYDIATFSNKEIVVTIFQNNSLISIAPQSSPQSTVIAQRLPINGLSHPSRVTVNKNAELIVLDDEAVKIFNRDYQPLHKFTLRPGKNSRPSCLAVDDYNLIAVGYKNKEEISLLQPNGPLIRTLPAPGIGRYLTTYKQQLIYTNWLGRKLVAVDYDGDMVFSVDIIDSGWPQGVCCDKDGSIYVAVWNAGLSSSGEVQQYGPDGKYIGCIIKECDNPWGLTFTSSDDLVVAAGKSVQIYQYD
ncbi:uncharacterized protein [Asterias amurensis]|uniref:uncharacterized protein n=1 Tax=Asterias amurensis TaxID=7602 RepID=UPI003AB153BC